MSSTVRGEFTFFRSALYDPKTRTPEEFAHLTRFRVCLSNGYDHFGKDDVRALRRAGSEYFIYLWFNGYYERELGRGESAGDAYIRRFPDMLAFFREVHRHPEWLLNRDRPLQGGGAVHPACFFDYGDAAFRRRYITFIQERLRRTGADGVFFDYVGSWALPDAARALWEAKRPGTAYDTAGVRFLRELRRAFPGVRLFGNQAFRLSADYYDDCLDYDLSESHATSFLWGNEARIYVQGRGMETVRDTFYRPWDGPNGFKVISRERRERSGQHPGVRVFDLNYLQPKYVPTGETARDENGRQVPVYVPRTDRAALFYGSVLARLTDTVAFASDWYAPGFGQDAVYFCDLGRPREEAFREEAGVVTRRFENGFVVATRKAETVRFQPPPDARKDESGLWDVYADAPAGRDGSIVLEPETYPATRSSYPAGRIYLYR